MKNCWSYSINTFLEKEGFIIARLTKRSSSKPYFNLRFTGKVLIALGLVFLNLGFFLINGRWLHSYHCNSMSGPYTSYEPIKGKILKYPPFNFEGKIVEKNTLE